MPDKTSAIYAEAFRLEEENRRLAALVKSLDESRNAAEVERDAWHRTADIRGSLLAGDDAPFRAEIAEAQEALAAARRDLAERDNAWRDAWNTAHAGGCVSWVCECDEPKSEGNCARWRALLSESRTEGCPRCLAARDAGEWMECKDPFHALAGPAAASGEDSK